MAISHLLKRPTLIILFRVPLPPCVGSLMHSQNDAFDPNERSTRFNPALRRVYIISLYRAQTRVFAAQISQNNAPF